MSEASQEHRPGGGGLQGANRALPIVGIGASAGGLEALQEFFDALPEDTGAAYVVVQHLSRDFRSLMDELLGRRTSMPVQMAGDGMPLEINQVYLIPPGHDLSVEKDTLFLKSQASEGLHLPIDNFLSSLSGNSHADAYAVILSGSGSDGARGIRDIKEQGGVVLVQEPETAKFDGMPLSTLRTGLADISLRPAEIAKQLTVLLDSPHTATPPEVDTTPSDAPGSAYDQLLDFLYRSKGVDFSEFKQGTISRRIERRALINSKRDIDDYLRYLTRTPAELDVLFQELLIGVTSFNRDPEAFAELRQILREPITAWNEERGPFRCWVSACSTGEEAYTIAMLLDELGREIHKNFEFKVFATDVSPQAISIGGQGVYPTSIEADLTPQLISAYFTREEDSYRVASRIRERVIFAIHDIAVDAPFTRMDLVTCRNMLIYFQRELQERVTSMLHFALRGGGILMLGPSESLISLKSDFETLNHRWKIFLKRAESRIVPLLHSLRQQDERQGPTQHTRSWADNRERTNSLLSEVFTGLFDLYVEAGFVFDEQQKLIYSFGAVEKYTRLPQGVVRLDSLSIIVDGLKSPMMLALRQSQSSGTDVSMRNVDVRIGEDSTRVDIRVAFREARGYAGKLYIALIEDSRPSALPEGDVLDADELTRAHVEELERELASTKESLQAAIEELETSNEEMQSTNEELVASNEELQSTNEELQSVNEELHTINTEYQNKIAELTEISADLEEFLNVADIGTVFLDSDLCIRKFTPGVRAAIPIRDNDLGRPISDLGNNLVGVELQNLVRESTVHGVDVDREVFTARGQRFYLRVRPYDSKTGSARGTLLAFVDMTSEEVARDDMLRFEGLLELLRGQRPAAVAWSYELSTASVQLRQWSDGTALELRAARARRGPRTLVRSAARAGPDPRPRELRDRQPPRLLRLRPSPSATDWRCGFRCSLGAHACEGAGQRQRQERPHPPRHLDRLHRPRRTLRPEARARLDGPR